VNAARENQDQILLSQVIGFVGMTALALAESALGQMPLFYGNVPRILLIMLFIITFLSPAVLPASMMLVIGIVYDLVQGNPPGYTSSMMMIVHMAVMLRRVKMADADAEIIWSEFSLVMAVVQIYGFLVLVAYTGHVPAMGPVVFQFATSVLLFPILYWLTILSANLSLAFWRSR